MTRRMDDLLVLQDVRQGDTQALPVSRRSSFRMIRHLHPTDTPALLPFKQRSGHDEAVSIGQAVRGGRNGFPLLKYSTAALSPRAWQRYWVMTRRASVQAVMKAGPRSGPLAWEVSELYLVKGKLEAAADMLEQLAFPAGTSGARRIILRLRADSDLFEAARIAGYSPVYGETLYRAESAHDLQAKIGRKSRALELRQLGELDEQSLFRLYCASAPIDVRSKLGQTLDEWKSALERPSRKFMSLGFEEEGTGRLAAQTLSCDVSGSRFFSIQKASRSGVDMMSLIAAGLGQANETPVCALVPSFQQDLGEELQELGFTAGDSYDVMVKTLAVPVTKTVPGLAAIER